MSLFHDDVMHISRDGAALPGSLEAAVDSEAGAAGADLYVERVGPADAPTLIYLHGGPGASAQPFREMLGEDLERYQVVYLDQRGGGRSYAAGDFDLDTLADDVEAVARSLELGSVVLLAHGFGAAVATRTALRHPARVVGMVWINPWLSMPRLAGTLHRQAMAMSDAEGLSPGALGEADEHAAAGAEALADAAFASVGAKPLLDALLFPDPAARLRLEHAEASLMLGPTESGTLTALWSTDVSDELPLLAERRLPLSILFATGDRSSVPDQAEDALARLPHALTAFMEGGHHPYVDDPVALLQLLTPALEHAGAPLPGPS